MKWGILSTGTIAKNFAQTAKQMPDVQVQAVASRSAGSAKAFAEAFAIPTAHDSYEALANDPNVDIVYVATPHSRHYEDMKLLIGAGKHVLCEKSFTTDAEQAKEIFALAKKKNVFVMEAFWTKFIPLYRQIEHPPKRADRRNPRGDGTVWLHHRAGSAQVRSGAGRRDAAGYRRIRHRFRLHDAGLCV